MPSVSRRWSLRRHLSRRLTSILVLVLLAVQAVGILLIYPLPIMAQTSGSQAGFIQIKAIGNYGNWLPSTETATQVEAIVSAIHQITGKDITIFSFLDGPELPSDKVQGWSGTLDSYLTAIKETAGGDIVPNLDLDYYMSGSSWLTHPYCDPDNATDCGPSFFYKTSAELLSLSAISSGNREVFLDAWPTLSRYESESVITGVLQNLTDQGWRHFIMKQDGSSGNPFPDYGYASYMGGVVTCATTSPFCAPDQDLIDQEYVNEASNSNFIGVFGLFDYQIINSPSSQTAFDVFAANLTTDQQATALANMASLQSSGRYIMSYPVLVSDCRDGEEHVFDANIETLSNGTSLLDLIESFIGSSSSSSSTTTSSSSTNTSSYSVTSTTTVSGSTTQTTDSTGGTSTSSQSLVQVDLGESGWPASEPGSVVTVDGEQFQASSLPLSFQWQVGSNHKYAWGPTLDFQNGTKIILQSVTGIGSSQSGNVTVPPSGGSIWATYTKSTTFSVKFQESGLPAGATIPISFAGNQTSVSNDSVVFSDIGPRNYSWFAEPYLASPETRYVPSPASGVLVVSGNETQMIDYSVQYQMVADSSPSSAGMVSPSWGWYSPGSNITLTAAANLGYEFAGWSGTGAGSYSGNETHTTIVLEGPVHECAMFNSAYSLTFAETGLAAGTQWNVTLDGLTENSTSSLITFYGLGAGLHHWSVPLTVYSGADVRFSSDTPSGSVSIPGYSDVGVAWAPEYFVTVVSAPGSPTVGPASGWYCYGSTIDLSAAQNSTTGFSTWETNSSSLLVLDFSSPNTTVVVMGPGTIDGIFKAQGIQSDGGPTATSVATALGSGPQDSSYGAIDTGNRTQTSGQQPTSGFALVTAVPLVSVLALCGALGLAAERRVARRRGKA